MTSPPEETEETFGIRVRRGQGRFGFVLSSAVIASVVLYTTATAFSKSYGIAFFSIPFFIGLVPGLLSEARPFRTTFWALLVSLGLSIVTLREGVVCVIMSLPVLVPFALIGTLCGLSLRRWFKDRRTRRGVGLTSVLLAIGWQALDGAADDPGRHPLHHGAATIEIAAPRERVFAALSARPLVVRRSWPWFLEIGLPIPERLEIVEQKLGGAVVLTQTTGTAYARIGDWSPPHGFSFAVERYVARDLPFHITRLGRSPSYGLRSERVEDWLTIREVRYDLESLPGGRTRLSRSVDWQRHLAPDVYFGWLQQTVMERAQTRLLSLIRESVESGSAPEGQRPRLNEFSTAVFRPHGRALFR